MLSTGCTVVHTSCGLPDMGIATTDCLEIVLKRIGKLSEVVPATA